MKAAKLTLIPGGRYSEPTPPPRPPAPRSNQQPVSRPMKTLLDTVRDAEAWGVIRYPEGRK